MDKKAFTRTYSFRGLNTTSRISSCPFVPLWIVPTTVGQGGGTMHYINFGFELSLRYYFCSSAVELLGSLHVWANHP